MADCVTDLVQVPAPVTVPVVSLLSVAVRVTEAGDTEAETVPVLRVRKEYDPDGVSVWFSVGLQVPVSDIEGVRVGVRVGPGVRVPVHVLREGVSEALRVPVVRVKEGLRTMDRDAVLVPDSVGLRL